MEYQPRVCFGRVHEVLGKTWRQSLGGSWMCVMVAEKLQTTLPSSTTTTCKLRTVDFRRADTRVDTGPDTGPDTRL